MDRYPNMTSTSKQGLGKFLAYVALAGGLGAIAPSAVWAQAAAPQNAVAATVNGAAIPQQLMDAAVANFVAQGAKDSPQLRDQVLIELIAREALVGEGLRLGLDKSPAFLQRLDDARRTLLMDAAWADYLTRNPITEAEERADYERQKKALGGGDSTPQFLVSHMVLADEAQAKAALERARKGEAFDKLASSLSIDATTKAKGGQIGWLLPSDVLPAIGTVISGLSKGAVAANPVQTPAGWQVVKVDDVRPFKIPTFEESRPQLKVAVQNTRRQKFIEELLKKAEIKRP
jgi:peptidyl-prolyl cis-trans isomerase C